jgi:hypothetical protein
MLFVGSFAAKCKSLLFRDMRVKQFLKDGADGGIGLMPGLVDFPRFS